MHRRDGKLIVSATDLVGFLECGHLTQLERAAAAGLISKPERSDEDPEVELLQRRGGEHEQRYLDLLRENGRVITDLSVAGDEWIEYETRAARTIEAMRRGDDVIFQATVFDGKWVGHPDFLLKVNTPREGSASPLSQITSSPAEDAHPGTLLTITRPDSNTLPPPPVASGLGPDWHYEVADTKLARSAKASALIQICSYVDQIERVQGVRPKNVYVVTGGAEIAEHAFRTAEMMAYYRHAKRRFEDALDEAKVGARTWPIPRDESYPDPVEHCGVCRWFPFNCRVQWRADDALPLVAGISRAQRTILTANSVDTMNELSQLTQPISFDGLKRGQAESLWKMREQARLQVVTAGGKVPAFELLDPERDSEGTLLADRGLSALPPPNPGDLFFDIEGDPFAFWEGLEYLFGVWETPAGDGLWDQDGYRGIWALNREQEKVAFEQVMDLFVKRWEQHPDMHIYHYAPYEPTALKRLAGRHATREEELDRMLRGHLFVDLYRVVRQALLVGAERYSIKNLEPLYGYTREIELRDAGSSIVEFERVLEIGDPDGSIKEKIRLYNRDDCVSTERLRNWLEQRRLQATDEFGAELPRPGPGDPDVPGEDLSARIAAVQDLERRLTESITKVEAAQSAEDKATWLVAYLLDWHRRENKSAWWRFYDLMTHSDEELFEEKEPIAGLVFVERIVREGRGITTDDFRYRFPAQEYGVGVGNDVHDPQLAAGETKTGTAVEVDDTQRTVDIRRSKTWTGQHPAAIVPLNIYRATAQQDSLMRFGDWVAVNGIASDAPEWRAARDLLLRHPPRAGQELGEWLGREGEPGKDTACRLAPQLDATTLAIQGPPGSGKTYTGARMILDLVRAGRKVGITSNSHKVIGNLLEAVCDAAQEAGVVIRAMQKGDEGEVLEHEFVDVKRAADNGEVDRALAQGEVDVVAGTPWLWARDEMTGAIDTLFVDEAGQVSLANVVAVSGAARNLVLLGDPQQLDQPTQGVHPGGAAGSALGHFLGDDETVPGERGVFLEKTWRMHPAITDYTSELFYEDKLKSVPGLERQEVLGSDWLSGSGLRWVAVPHDGNTNASEEEAKRVVEIVTALLGREWRNKDGELARIGVDDIRIVSPFNAHRLLIDELLAEAGVEGIQVGTVDKFQGQQAPVSIYTMATSRPEDAPRGIDFLYSLNRLNVATSRARALTIVVCSPALLSVAPKTPEQLRMANGLAAFVEAAVPIS